jgi:hypothetical protein
LTKRAGIPAGILHQKDASTKQIEIEKRKAERKENLSQSLRKPDETLEEKKARKKLVKEQRQVFVYTFMQYKLCAANNN